MERSRFRESGGPTYTYGVPGNTTVSSGNQNFAQWTEGGIFADSPSLSSKPCSLLGSVVMIPPPPFVYNDWTQAWHPTLTDEYRSQISELVKSTVDYKLYAALQSGNHSAILESDNYSYMADVIGSGFKKNKGKRIIVNPCSSFARSTFATNESIGEDDIYVTVNLSGDYNGFLIYVSTWGDVSGTVGVPSSIHSSMISHISEAVDDTDQFEHLYSSAIADVEDGVAELLTIIGEWNKTASFLAGKIVSVGKIIKQVRHLDFSFLKKKPSLDDLSQAWLEARYAVRPLILDAQNIMQALSKSGALNTRITKHRTGGNSYQVNHSFSMSDSGVSYTCEGVSVVEQTARAVAYARLQLDAPGLYNWGLTNVTKAAWELLPWSFVVDWFVNSAGLLASLNPNPVYAVEAGSLSVKSTVTTVLTVTAESSGYTKSLTYSDTSSFYSRVKKKDAVPLSINVNLSVPKVIDILLFLK